MSNMSLTAVKEREFTPEPASEKAEGTTSVFDAFTIELVREVNALPVKVEQGVLHVMCENPSDIYLQQRLEIITGKQVTLFSGAIKDIEKGLASFQERYDQLEGMSEEFKLEIVVDNGEGETYKGLEVGDEAEGPIVKLINTLISSALKKRVSDIHMECYEFSVKIKYRIDGVLYPATEDLDKSFHASLVSRLKVMAELDIAEKRVPQDGRFKLRVGKRDVDFRISVIPGFFGENVVVRVLDNLMSRDSIGTISLKTMGFSPGQLDAFEKAINEPHGMVLVTGPTGSGKTTTLYAAIKSINTVQQKIITIEDPIEYHLEGVMQIPVNTKKGLTFSKGLRSILRHDPDKILVGEIRDGETAEIAVQSALTGHLVFSSVHANNAFDVLARLQNIGANLHNCLSALNCVISQRLVRLNCEHCAVEQAIEPCLFIASGFGNNSNEWPKVYKGLGCDHCGHTGYSGRSMICEILVISDEIRQALLDGSSVTDLIKNTGLVDRLDLRRSAVKLVYSGKANLEEINRVTFNK